jgi:hypothetical protein
MVDLLHLYDQIGVDVLARMREFNKARIKGPLSHGGRCSEIANNSILSA